MIRVLAILVTLSLSAFRGDIESIVFFSGVDKAKYLVCKPKEAKRLPLVVKVCCGSENADPESSFAKNCPPEAIARCENDPRLRQYRKSPCCRIIRWQLIGVRFAPSRLEPNQPVVSSPFLSVISPSIFVDQANNISQPWGIHPSIASAVLLI